MLADAPPETHDFNDTVTLTEFGTEILLRATVDATGNVVEVLRDMEEILISDPQCSAELEPLYRAGVAVTYYNPEGEFGLG